jgi:hypothetical protein
MSPERVGGGEHAYNASIVAKNHDDLKIHLRSTTSPVPTAVTIQLTILKLFTYIIFSINRTSGSNPFPDTVRNVPHGTIIVHYCPFSLFLCVLPHFSIDFTTSLILKQYSVMVYSIFTGYPSITSLLINKFSSKCLSSFDNTLFVILGMEFNISLNRVLPLYIERTTGNFHFPPMTNIVSCIAFTFS